MSDLNTECVDVELVAIDDDECGVAARFDLTDLHPGDPADLVVAVMRRGEASLLLGVAIVMGREVPWTADERTMMERGIAALRRSLTPLDPCDCSHCTLRRAARPS